MRLLIFRSSYCLCLFPIRHFALYLCFGGPLQFAYFQEAFAVCLSSAGPLASPHFQKAICHLLISNNALLHLLIFTSPFCLYFYLRLRRPLPPDREGDYADPHASEESPRIMARRRGRRARLPRPSDSGLDGGADAAAPTESSKSDY